MPTPPAKFGPPTNQTSFALAAHTSYQWPEAMGLGDCHSTPFQCRIRPYVPAAHTSLALVADTASRKFVEPTASVNAFDQVVPSQCRRTLPPTLQASLAAPAQTSVRDCVVPDGISDHVLPVQCNVVPPAPTAHTSAALVPETPFRSCVVGDAA